MHPDDINQAVKIPAITRRARTRAGYIYLASAMTADDLYAWLLCTIAAHPVGERPDRIEPRARKRRPKKYPHLHRPRHEARTYRYAKS